MLSGCGSWSWGWRSAGPVGWGGADRQDPALSGNGRVLASVVRRDGRDTVLLQEQPSGTVLPLRHFGRLQPHRSPSLSWNGRYLALLVQQGPERRVLASVVRRDGGDTVLLQEQPSGTVLPLRHFGRLQPHRSPSLSWNGRYLALLVQQGPERRVLIEDRASGRLHRLPLPGGLVPESLSLAADGRRIAIAMEGDGRSRVQLYDLTALLEPDLPAGLPVPGAPAATP